MTDQEQVSCLTDPVYVIKTNIYKSASGSTKCNSNFEDEIQPTCLSARYTMMYTTSLSSVLVMICSVVVDATYKGLNSYYHPSSQMMAQTNGVPSSPMTDAATMQMATGVPMMEVMKMMSKNPASNMMVSKMAEVVRNMAGNPMTGGTSDLMAAMSNPMTMANQMNSMPSMSNPMAAMSNPMASMSNPMAALSNSMVDMSNPMTAIANAMAMSNPMNRLAAMSNSMNSMSNPMANSMSGAMASAGSSKSY